MKKTLSQDITNRPNKTVTEILRETCKDCLAGAHISKFGTVQNPYPWLHGSIVCDCCGKWIDLNPEIFCESGMRALFA